MNLVISFLAVFITCISFSQTNFDDEITEEVARFESAIVDYEIYNGKPIALIKENGEYFIYYKDSSDAGLFQSFDIFFPTDFEVDGLGNLYIIGVDSAFQISVGNHIEKVRRMGIAEYQTRASLSTVYFNKSIASKGGSRVRFYEYDNQLDSVGGLISDYKMKTIRTVGTSRRSAVARADSRSSLDQPLKDDRTTNMQNDVVSTPRYVNRNQLRSNELTTSIKKDYPVNSFRKGQELWVIDEIEYRLAVLDEYGTLNSSNLISPCPYRSKFYQDAANGSVYVLTKSSGKIQVQLLKESGSLVPAAELSKGLTISDIKIFDGFVYYRDNKGKGEGIKRSKLD